jgi:hypothetical protein
MGSFSWLKADTLTKTANIAYDEKFKFLIPKDFDPEGIGCIEDRYRDYGDIVDASGREYDMYELLAIFNSDYRIPKDYTRYNCKTDEKTTFTAGTRVGDILLGVDPNKPLKTVDENTVLNRSLGIEIGCYDKQIDQLQFPLKLVSPEYKGTYEQCVGKSYGDPEQGCKLSRNRLYRGDAFRSEFRYDGKSWKDIHAEWTRQDPFNRFKKTREKE